MLEDETRFSDEALADHRDVECVVERRQERLTHAVILGADDQRELSNARASNLQMSVLRVETHDDLNPRLWALRRHRSRARNIHIDGLLRGARRLPNFRARRHGRAASQIQFRDAERVGDAEDAANVHA